MHLSTRTERFIEIHDGLYLGRVTAVIRRRAAKRRGLKRTIMVYIALKVEGKPNKSLHEPYLESGNPSLIFI